MKSNLNVLIIFFSIFINMNSFAEITRISFKLPHEEKNWITISQVQDEYVIVCHKEGVLISNDFGKSFFQAQFDGKIENDFSDIYPKPIVHIDKKSQKIFVGIGYKLYVSQDFGRNFVKSRFIGQHFEGVNQIISSDNNVYLNHKFSSGHDTCDTNMIFVSRNGGYDFSVVKLGYETCASITDIALNKDKLFVKINNFQRDGLSLFLSEDKGNHFKNVELTEIDWLEILKKRNIELNAFKEKLEKLDIPTFKIYPTSNLEKSFQISYDNMFFNPQEPTPQIIYQFINSSGNTSYISSDLIPRNGFVNVENQIFYYNSFKELWVDSTMSSVSH